MKKIILYIFTIVLLQNAYGQNIPHANYTAPWGVKVNTYNGNLYLQRNELIIPNQGLSIEFGFAFNSFRDTLDLGFGKGWTMNYNLRYEQLNADSMAVEHADGRRDIFVRNGSSYSAPEGIFDEWTEDTPGSFLLTTKYGMRYYFDDSNHKSLTKIEDVNNNQSILEYNADGELIKVEDHSGRIVNLSWTDGHLQTITDDNFSATRSIEFNYDGDQLISVTDPETGTMTYSYNDQGNLDLIVNERGDDMQIRYNEKERVANIITCIADITFTYNSDSGNTFVNEKNTGGDRVTAFHYDETGKLIQKTGNCCGFNTKYEYDADNNVNTLLDANGNEFTANHDAQGNALLTSDAMGANQSFSFSPTLNRLTAVTDKNGNTTNMQYDGDGNLEKIIRPGAIELGFTYSTEGNVSAVSDGNGNNTNLTYNDNNDVISVEYPIGTEMFTYDEAGNLLTSIDGNGNSVTYEYDKLNRVQRIRDDLGNEVNYSYDLSSNLSSEIDPNGNLKSLTYDAHHRLESVETPAGLTQYLYDASDNLTGIIDANEHTTSFEYDVRDLLVSEKDALNNTTYYSYDGNGNVLTRMDANGDLTNYTYDKLNRLLSKTYDGNTDSYTYDPNGNLILCSNNDISISFTYDALNRLLSKSINNWGTTVSYTYDGANNRTSMTDPSGTTTYEYDANNRLVKITNPQGETTDFAYDTGGRMVRQDYNNNTFTEYTYDGANRLLSLIHKNNANIILASYEYTYDLNGNRTSMTTLEGTATYTYDGDNRLLNATYDGIATADENYTFDAVGNRTEFNDTTYTFDVADRLLTAGSTTYDFDDNGNTILKNENGNLTHYKYDGENRLLEVELPSGEKTTFKYDPFGNRISQENMSGTTRYLLDGDNVLMELDENNNETARYTSGLSLDSWISMERDGQSYFYHTDGLGSITALTNSNQTIANEYQYDSYGNVFAQTEAVENPYKFTGRERDEATGLYYYRTRYYDVEVSRFLTKDGFRGFMSRPMSLNKFVYTENNPINNVDPYGEFIPPPIIWGILEQLGENFLEHGTNIDCYTFTVELTDLLEGKSKGLKYVSKRLKILEKTLGKHRNGYGVISGKIIRGAQKSIGFFRRQIEKLKKGVDIIEKNVDEVEDFIEDNFGFEFDDLDFTVDEEKCNASKGSQDEEKNKESNGSPVDNNDDGSTVCIPIIRSMDPNEIIAPEGCGIEHWIAQSATLPYTILYENDPDFATAPAQKVVIEHVFDSDINPFTFRLGDFGFGEYYFTVPNDVSFYNTQIDLSDSLGVLLDVVAGFDVNNNKAFWIFESKDPLTGFANTLLANVGYLPVNDSLTHAGEGFVNFTVRADDATITGDTIHADAEIIFDDNPPIETNVEFNFIDADYPVSQISNIIVTGNEYQLFWSSTDLGSGTSSYDLFVSTDSTVFFPVADNLGDTTYTFIGQADSTYQFFTVATDCAGNREPLKELVACALTLADTTLVQPTNADANGSIAIEMQNSSGPLTYEWSPNVSNSSIATGLISGTYNIIVTDSLGCSYALEIELNSILINTNEIEKPFDLFIHRLYPSPVQTQITIEFSTPEKSIWLEVFDATGKRVMGKTISATPYELNQELLTVGDWAAGMYTVRIRTKKNTVSGIFVKQ